MTLLFCMRKNRKEVIFFFFTILYISDNFFTDGEFYMSEIQFFTKGENYMNYTNTGFLETDIEFAKDLKKHYRNTKFIFLSMML